MSGYTELAHALVSSGNCPSLEMAQGEIEEMRARVLDDEDPCEILHEYGLEPDYVFDILW